jgi:hypothetical protein
LIREHKQDARFVFARFILDEVIGGAQWADRMAEQ